jgi:hypothetical protein
VSRARRDIVSTYWKAAKIEAATVNISTTCRISRVGGSTRGSASVYQSETAAVFCLKQFSRSYAKCLKLRFTAAP